MSHFRFRILRLVIANTTSSYALFKAKDKKLLDDDDLASRLQSADLINNEYVRTSSLYVFQSLAKDDLTREKSTGSSSRRS